MSSVNSTVRKCFLTRILLFLRQPPETWEAQSALLDAVERLENGVMMLAGNRALISLNLSSK